MANQQMVKVIALCSFATPGWVCEKGDLIDVPLADARRMISRGMARESPEHKLPKATAEEMEAARVLDVETAEVYGDPKAKLETAVRVRPARRRAAPAQVSVAMPGRVAPDAGEGE